MMGRVGAWVGVGVRGVYSNVLIPGQLVFIKSTAGLTLCRSAPVKWQICEDFSVHHISGLSDGEGGLGIVPSPVHM